MDREDVISRLRQHEAELKQAGVEHLYLFGSAARDEARNDSDIDLFFDHRKGELGLFELMDVAEQARRILELLPLMLDHMHRSLRRRDSFDTRQA